jgi:hypothetical protein
MLRACFWLLAAVIGVMLAMQLGIALGCIIGPLTQIVPPGTCQQLGFVEAVREMWAEVLTAVFALLAVARPPPPPPPPPEV